MTGGFRTECQGMAGWADLLFVNAQAFTTEYTTPGDGGRCDAREVHSDGGHHPREFWS